jgi:hypothetical protein
LISAIALCQKAQAAVFPRPRAHLYSIPRCDVQALAYTSRRLPGGVSAAVVVIFDRVGVVIGTTETIGPADVAASTAARARGAIAGDEPLVFDTLLIEADLSGSEGGDKAEYEGNRGEIY